MLPQTEAIDEVQRDEDLQVIIDLWPELSEAERHNLKELVELAIMEVSDGG